MAKNIFIGIGVVLVLLVGLVVVAPSFIDSAALKQQITSEVRNATGRDLSIDGNLEIRVFPTPALTANGVRLSNADGAAAAEMVMLKAVEVRVALMPLLSGQVQVKRIRLVSPVIHLEKFADGHTNMEFQSVAPSGMASAPTTGGADAAPSTDSAKDGLNVRLDNFEIVDGQVIYRDGATGQIERVQNIDATLRAASLQGPFDVKGQARVRGVPLAYEVSLGQIIEERTVPLNAVLDAPGGARAQITGAVLDLASAPRFKGKLKVEGKNLAQLLDAVAGSAVAPALTAQNFAVDSQIDASAAQVAIDELDLLLGKTRTTGSISAALDKGVTFEVKLKSTRIDLDALLSAGATGASRSAAGNAAEEEVPQSTAVAPAPPKTQAESAKAASGFAFPKGVNGTVQVTVDALTLKGGLVSNVRLTAELADGELALNQLQAMAPGVTDVAMFGFVRPRDGVPRFEGQAELTSSDVLGLSEWAGVKLPDGVAGRVKRISYKSNVAADAKQVVVSDLKIMADKSTLTGGVTLALRKRLSFGADLRLDTLNLDTYMNGTGQETPSGAPAAKTNAAQAPQAAAKAEKAGALDALEAWAALSALNGFDANMKVRVGALTHQSQTVRDVMFDGTLYAGTLELRSFKVGDYVGATSDVSGNFTGFGGIPEMSKVKLNATVKDAGRLASSFGADGVPKGVKTVKLQANAEGSLLKPRFNAAVQALGGQFGAAGRFSLLPIGFGYDGTVSAQHGDLMALLRTLEVDYAPSGPLGALDMNAKLKTDGKTHTVTDLKSSVGDTAINGAVTAHTDGAKPNIIANLTTGALVMDRFLPKAQKNASFKPQKPRKTRWGMRPETSNVVNVAFNSDAQLAAADKRWSREAFDLSALNLLNGEVTLKSDAIQFGDYKLTSADIHATIQDGVLNADRIQGNLFGGPVDGTAIVRADANPTVQSTIKLDALKVDQAVKAITGKDLASGNLSLNLGIDAKGMSPAALVSSLAGQGSLNIGALDVKKGGKGSALSGVIGLVEAMNQLSLGAAKKGSGLADLALDFNIKDGVANATKMALNSAMGSGTGTGTVDIAGWAIDVAGDVTVEANVLTTLLSKGKIGKQKVPFAVKGALDNPDVNLALGNRTPGANNNSTTQQKIDPFKSLIQKALPGVKLPDTQPKTQPAPSTQPADGTLAPPPPQSGSTSSSETQPKKVKPADLLRGVLGF